MITSFSSSTAKLSHSGNELEMPNDPLEDKTEWVRRLHCAEGHLRGITTMIERGADCQSIVHQILAVQSALREINGLVVKHHLTVCLAEQLQNADEPASAPCLAEVISLYQLLGGSLPPFDRKEHL